MFGRRSEKRGSRGKEVWKEEEAQQQVVAEAALPHSTEESREEEGMKKALYQAKPSETCT